MRTQVRPVLDERSLILAYERLAQNPSDASALFNIAATLAHKGNWATCEQMARQCCRHMQSGAPFGSAAYQILAVSLREQNRPLEAIRACNEAELCGFGGMLIDFERAFLLSQSGNLSKALGEANRCCGALALPEDADPEIADTYRWILRGNILSRMDRLEEALESFDRAANKPLALLARGQALENAQQPHKALEDYVVLAENAEFKLEALKSAARCCIRLGLPKPASEFLRKAWELNKQDWTLWQEWIDACELWGHLPSILEAYETHAKFKGLSYENEQRYRRARKAAGL